MAPRGSLTAATLLLLSPAARAGCPNACSGHGRCVGVSTCECYGAWTGGDCSLRRCPLGPAWADVATSDDVAHAPAECSNRGTCNRATGTCGCLPGYEGVACSRSEWGRARGRGLQRRVREGRRWRPCGGGGLVVTQRPQPALALVDYPTTLTLPHPAQ